MPKRTSDGRAGPKCRRRRLYLVTNDGEEIYGIRKFDLWSDDPPSSSSNDGHAAAQRLPRAVVRLEALASRLFASIGAKIMVMDSTEPERIVPVFDVRTRCVALGPRHGSRPTWPMYLPVGGKLAVLDDDCSELCNPVQWGWSSQRPLPNPAFFLEDITAHAAHPDGRTVFISGKAGKAATYSLDAKSEGAEWRCHGRWKLPFAGRAHFDPRLDAWIGLSGDSLGHLCSCDVVATDPGTSRKSPPAWKLGKEKLFCEDAAEQHIGASLVYMGVARFCLVQYFSVAEDDVGSSGDDVPSSSHRYMLRLKAFSVMYDKKGDLRTAELRRVRCYQLHAPSSMRDLLDPVAFWL